MESKGNKSISPKVRRREVGKTFSEDFELPSCRNASAIITNSFGLLVFGLPDLSVALSLDQLITIIRHLKIKFMSFKKLNSNIHLAIAAFVGLFFVVACNDSDKSGKSSTTTDTANTANSTPTVAPAKKVGKASVKMAGDETGKMEKDKMGYYNRTEVSPIYPGGQDALQTYVTNTLEYPQNAIDNNIEGTVKVQFAIDEQGNVSNAKSIGEKLGYGLEEEAVKLVSTMPKWTPGMVKGKKVKAWYTLPVTYRLEG
jgi:periplasmic protein TonB